MIDEYLEWLEEQDVDEEFAIDSLSTGKPYKFPPINESNNDSQDTVKRILIDFDGVIHRYSKGWNGGEIYDPPIGGAKQFIDRFRNELGYEVVIFTSRLSELSNGTKEVIKQKIKINEWLDKYKIEVDDMTSEKLSAVLYIDDRAYRFEGQWDKEEWNTITSILSKNK